MGLYSRVNEIDPRRRELLELLGFSPSFHNAKFIHDLLSPDIKPDCVIMNPPFSATIARRLGNMGALTKVDQRAEKAGNLDKYNLESKEGRAALNVVYTRIMNGGRKFPISTIRNTRLLTGDS